MRIIDALEDGPRGIYSGAIGYFSLSGAVELGKTIRTAVATPDALSYGAGGAVIALSDPADEYAETLTKAAPFRRLVQGL
jgi:para-aminobenzoate synthetase